MKNCMVCKMPATYGDGESWALCNTHQYEWDRVWKKIAKAIMRAMARPLELTWICRICKKERPDDKINVLSYPEKNWPTTTINTKYCNDSPLCFKGALRKKKKGEI